jgi:hypothetical protein
MVHKRKLGYQVMGSATGRDSQRRRVLDPPQLVFWARIVE